MVYFKVLLKTQDGLLNTADNRTSAQVNGTQVSTTLGHQMPLPGGILISGQLDPTYYCSLPLDASTGGVHWTEGQPDPKADKMSS